MCLNILFDGVLYRLCFSFAFCFLCAGFAFKARNIVSNIIVWYSTMAYYFTLRPFLLAPDSTILFHYFFQGSFDFMVFKMDVAVTLHGLRYGNKTMTWGRRICHKISWCFVIDLGLFSCGLLEFAGFVLLTHCLL